MSDRTKDYLLYFSIGLNVALVIGMLMTGLSEESFLSGEEYEEHERETEEWRELENRMTRLEQETRPLRRKIAQQQKELLRSLKNSRTDTRTIQSIHDGIHRYQRKLQNRTLEILLKQRRNLSKPARERVFNRLLERHRQRYRSLYSEREEGEEYEDEDHDDH